MFETIKEDRKIVNLEEFIGTLCLYRVDAKLILLFSSRKLASMKLKLISEILESKNIHF